MRSELHILLRSLSLALALALVGAVTGATYRLSHDTAPVAAHCEDDECEGGKRCKDNPGGNTNCAFEGTKCKTSGCEAEEQ